MEKIIAVNDYEGKDGYSGVSGFEVVTDKQSIKLFIDNSQSCCENWGYFFCNDDPQQFIGSDLREVVLTDTALNEAQMKANELNPNDKLFEGGVMFVNLAYHSRIAKSQHHALNVNHVRRVSHVNHVQK